MKEFYVARKFVIDQGFNVKAKTAAEAEEIIAALPDYEGRTEDEEVKDRRVTYVGGVEVMRGPTFFVRTKKWQDSQ